MDLTPEIGKKKHKLSLNWPVQKKKKKYLTEVFQVGENTEKRADPTSVSKAMHKVKHSDGFNILDKNDSQHTTHSTTHPQQIAGFFPACQQRKRIAYINPARKHN